MNDLTVLKKDLGELPKYNEDELAENKELTSVLSSSIRSIRLSTEKKFFVRDGETKLDVGNKIVGVFVGTGKLFRRYYEKPYSGESTIPDCCSSDGITPDPSIEKPVCKTCAKCDFSQFGSALSGKGKRCSDYRYTVLCVFNDTYENGYRLYRLAIPPASLTAFSAYSEKLLKGIHGIPLIGVVTEASYDPEKLCGLQFNPVRILKADELANVRDIAKDPLVEKMLTVDVIAAVKEDIATETAAAKPPKKETIKPDVIEETEEEINNILADVAGEL